MMKHLSENSSTLKTRYIDGDIKYINEFEKNVALIILPFYNNVGCIPNDLYNIIDAFLLNGDDEATYAIISSPVFAADYCSRIPNEVNLKLWVAVKRECHETDTQQLQQAHEALLVFTKYKGSLRHTKTRMAYTYCPSCKRTTKDYGGKKHLYHEFGTLMSDTWRNITVKDEDNTEIIEILKDMFGIEPYTYLNIYDQRQYYKELNNSKICYKSCPETENELKSASVLYNDDSIKILKEIPDNSIDFCFADPPYNIRKKYDKWDDSKDIIDYFEWCDEWLKELARVLKPGRTLAVLNIPQWCVRHYRYLSTVLDYQDWIVWEALGLPVRQIMPAHYTVLCFTKGQPREIPGLKRKEHTLLENKSLETIKNDYCIRPNCISTRREEGITDTEFISNFWWNIHRLKHNSRRLDHPCQLPPQFMLRLIALFTNEREKILDPFNGIGTSTLCAEMLNRKYIGIEISEYYHDIALKRHEELKMGIDPFRKQKNNIPQAKNSRVGRIKKQVYIVSKKKLQLDVKNIKDKIGKIPTRDDVLKYSQYPINLFDNYFIDWGEVTAAARTTGMSEFKKESTEREKYIVQNFELF